MKPSHLGLVITSLNMLALGRLDGALKLTVALRSFKILKFNDSNEQLFIDSLHLNLMV